jgi:hypothetical protein
MSRRIGTFVEFKEHTLAIARGDRQVNPHEPRVWSEPRQQLIEEPDFKNEKELEDAVALAIKRVISPASQTILLHGFGLDLAVFAEHAGDFRTLFFEIKAFASNHGRCGFGNQRGEGNQIRLLFDDIAMEPRSKLQLSLFNPTVRWLLGNRSRPVGSPRFVLFTCEQAQDAAMGGVRPGKQNNLRLSAFENLWITWPELLKRVGEFIA